MTPDELNEEFKGQTTSLKVKGGKGVRASEVRITGDSVSWHDKSSKTESKRSFEEMDKIVVKNHSVGALEGAGFGVLGGGIFVAATAGYGLPIGPVFIFAGLAIGGAAGHTYNYVFNQTEGAKAKKRKGPVPAVKETEKENPVSSDEKIATAKGKGEPKFKLGLGVGYANGKVKGILLTAEPAYCPSARVALGLRFEGAGDTSTKAVGSITFNLQYYLTDSKAFRPFFGAGVGTFNLKQIGYYPRIGFDSKHFTVAIEYNFVAEGKSPGGIYYSTGGPLTFAPYGGEPNNSYFGIRIGGFLDGRR